MKTQISRDTFQTEQRYSGVYLQQGRMILDADWNELTDLQKQSLADALRDAISGTNESGDPVAGGAPRNGGLRLYADPAGSASLRIQPGNLYVEGVPARLTGDPMAVDAQPEYPLPAGSGYTGQSQRLYADVWERSVTALENEDLLDAGLHGADTATRTQTMLQVKWCAAATDPLDASVNPAIGDAALSLRLRSVSSGGDACDPCASHVDVDERIGNYLFRVEVHDYKAGVLTLKWSRDNGAEACATAAMPGGFNQGDWVWEFFDDATERLLGNHLATTASKLRGLIKESYAVPNDPALPSQYARQWDGYIEIKLSDGSGLKGMDRGVTLFKDVEGNSAQGRVVLGGDGVLKINLERLELALATQGARFVPGDYWQAAVREAVDDSGDTVLDQAAPRGPRHHYLLLAETLPNGKLKDLGDAFRRRMAFPPLSGLMAADVGLVNTCAGLYGAAENVQQALDNLCDIGAEDIAYVLPNCAGNTVRQKLGSFLAAFPDPTVKDILDTLLCQLNAATLPYTRAACANDALAAALGLGSGDDTVGEVLDKMLCQLNADTLPLDKADPALCSDLKASGVDTVQDALNILCGKSGSGCAVVATSPSHLQTLLDDFAADSTAQDLWICLKAGTYPLAAVTLAGKRNLRISGQGRESTRVDVSGVLTWGVTEVILENLAMAFSASARLALTCEAASAQGCYFSRTANAQETAAMVGVSASGECRLDWRGNVHEASAKVTSSSPTTWAEKDIVGDAKVSAFMLALEDASLTGGKDYKTALSKAVTALVGMPLAKRQAWKAKLDTLNYPAFSAGRIKFGGQPGIQELKNVLLQAKPASRAASSALQAVTALRVRYYDDNALHLSGDSVGGVIADNHLDGWLRIGPGDPGYASPETIFNVASTLGENLVNSGGAELRLAGNRVNGIKTNLPSGAVSDNVLQTQVDGHQRISLLDNVIDGEANCIVAAHLVAQGNTWKNGDADLGTVIADRAVFSGNVVNDDQDLSRVTVTINANRQPPQLMEMGNLLLEIQPVR